MADTDISALDGHLRAQLERLQALEQKGDASMLMVEISRTRAMIRLAKQLILSANISQSTKIDYG